MRSNGTTLSPAITSGEVFRLPESRPVVLREALNLFGRQLRGTSEQLYRYFFELFLTDVNFRTVVTNALVRQKDPACTASVVAVIVGDRTLPCVPEPARQN
jgi:hypothetical protein